MASVAEGALKRLRAEVAPAAGADGARNRELRRARRHSALVRMLRLLLPVLAVLAFGLYFVGRPISFSIGGGTFTATLPTFDGENLKMDNPRYEGYTREGGRYIVAAKIGYQDFRNPTVIRLKEITADVTQPNSEWAKLVAVDGVYDTKEEQLTLRNKIKVTSSNGMTAHLKSALLLVKDQIITSKEPVFIEMTTGTTTEAERLKIDVKAKELTLDGNVRSHLVRPEAKGDGAPAGAETVGLRGRIKPVGQGERIR
jgi:hypothetical protein